LIAVAPLIVGLMLAGTGPARPAVDLALDVPYVPQTEALCGGAAAAMVLRYWGDAHAGVQEFASIVDARAGGITADALIRTIDRRGWRTSRFSGSVDLLRGQLRDGHPVIVLIEDRPNRYHYVVVVGAAGDGVVVHDPARGPSRRLSSSELMRRWKPANFWSLVILPSESLLKAGPAANIRTVTTSNGEEYTSLDTCERSFATAVAEAQRLGIDSADAIFDGARRQCPQSPGPLRELAGVRFAQQRWRDAASLAAEALKLDGHDEYTWDVLASSRFMQDDTAGALEAWNRIGKPRIDAVHIEGLTRTRYSLITDALSLSTGSLLTPDKLLRARRRLDELPDASTTRLDYRPQPDGFAGIDVALVEESARPRGAIEWASRSVRTIVDRELTVAVPALAGEGELWTASWRWWHDRPRVALSLAAPHLGALPGVWRVEGSWETQTYAFGSDGIAREERVHGGLTVADWLNGALRYELSAGFDSWNGAHKTASIGASIERRFAGDRAALSASATTWKPFAAEPAFQSAAARARFTSSTGATGTIYMGGIGFEAVTTAAPLALWSGAGDGRARAPLLRAHPLLDGGVISGPVFGRRLTYANGEVQRWSEISHTIRVGVAGFVDVAGASRRIADAAGDRLQVDVGGGLRVKVPGQEGALRIDVGRGIRDGAHALTFGWQF